MVEVNIIGTGNVAWHLAHAFSSENEIVVMQVAGRSSARLKKFENLAQETVFIKNLTPAEVTIVAVNDDAIAEVLAMIPFKSCLVVHTSGYTEMNLYSDDSLSRKRNRQGVFYPLQSFSKEDTDINFSEIPILIEAEDPKDIKTLRSLAEVISDHIEVVTSKQRRLLHLAAVFANNFTNHLYTVSEQLCEESNVPFSLLHALIAKTASKAITNSPSKSQTGPAKRGDLNVIAAQRALLQDPDHIKLYNTLTASLQHTHGKKL